MSGVAVPEMPRIEIEHAHKEGDEETGVAVAEHPVVHATDDSRRFRLALGQQTESTAGHGHEQRGGYTLARYVADTEVEALFTDEVVVEIAADRLAGVSMAWI